MEGEVKIRSFSCSLKNLKDRPNEDSFGVSGKYPIFAVADGVSRTRNPDGSYPDPSGARVAAEVFCEELIASLEEGDGFKDADLKALRQAFFNVNFAIRILNIKQGIFQKLDYLGNDYFGTCGVAGFVKGDTLYYGYLGDCGLRIYSHGDLLRLVSVDEVAPLEEYRDSLSFESKAERMLFWRKVLRNKPGADYLTYGIFTGEPEAKHYYHFGKIKLFPGDFVFLYSDGFLPFIKKPEFRQLFRIFKGHELEQKISEFVEAADRQFSDDKTLIAILVE